MTSSFEATFGYPAGENKVRLVDEADLAAVTELATMPVAAADLMAFYGYVGEVVLSDIGNGYFIHPAQLTLGHYREEGTIVLPAAGNPHGLVFASDGGGILFAADSEGAVHRSSAASFSGGFERVTENLTEFLDLIHRSVVRFAATGEPGSI
ncbi:hypothetical protein ACIRRA_31050 [Nocardia sp. NPDC101769]|uniref:hypothetical protein n=1 Tax=Nocardia sp. NPDC101769 TaxID=3364333 RepID=UPI00382F9698